MSSPWSSESGIVERDPTGRYVRYNHILGEGTSKIVYKGFDQVNGKEIAWCQALIKDEILKSRENLERVCAEAILLKLLDHENIVKCYDSWIDGPNKTIHMITELFTSENLRRYSKNHAPIKNTAIKNWCRQILKGLHYLHSCDPPIIHRDVKAENIFVNGNLGKVKLGDLGTATFLEPGSCEQSYLGTLQFMPPESFEGNYSQRVDIHSFGMCVLQMVTPKHIYKECKGMFDMYKRARGGVKPVALSSVTDPEVKQFIERCLVVPASNRPTAIDLLNNDPFLAPSVSVTSETSSSLSLIDSVASPRSGMCDQMDRLLLHLAQSPVVVKNISYVDTKLKLKGRMKDNVTILMTLGIIYYDEGKIITFRSVEFDFSLETDSVQSMMGELATRLELLPEDIALATGSMEQLITELKSGSSNNSDKSSVSEDYFNLCNLFDENPSSAEPDDSRRTHETSSQQQQESSSRQSASNRTQHNQDEDQEQRGYESENEGRDNRKEKGRRRSKKQPCCFGKLSLR